MSLLQMSFSGGVLILVIMVLRAVFINRLPKKTFLTLWWLALLRLMLPVAIPSGFSAYSIVRSGLSGLGFAGEPAGVLAVFLPGLQEGQSEEGGIFGNENHISHLAEGGSRSRGELQKRQLLESGISAQNAGQETGLQAALHGQSGSGKYGEMNPSSMKRTSSSEAPSEPEGERITGKGSPGEQSGSESGLYSEVFGGFGGFRGWSVIWGIGAVLCAGFFIFSYVLCRLEFRMTLPVKDAFAEQWRKAHPLRRTIAIRSSDRISAPLTYGVLRPVIVLPGKADRMEPAQLEYILLHEYVHIRRLDAVTKLLIALALCIHWPNPFAWVMYILFNRDIELACDEEVIRLLGMDKRASYALTLIDMEEKKRSLMPLCNGFGRNAGKNTMNERITAIMKIKKTSICGILAAMILVASVTTVFATTAAPKNHPVCTVPGTDFTEQEYSMLLALRFDGYENMTISEFQDKVWKMTDTEEYRDLLDRFAEDETLEQLKDENEIASFLHYCLLPLTAEKWEVRSFGGSAVSDPEGAMDHDHGVLEYFLTLVVLDGDALRISDYLEARAGIFAELDAWLQERSEAELQDAQKMSELIDAEREALHQKWDSRSLTINVESFFTPLMYYTENSRKDSLEDAGLWIMSLKEREAQWAEILAPYMPFGLSYEYDQPTDDFKMYYKGKEVRGLVDEERELWIAEHAGIGRGIYAEDAIELYAVYEGGVLQGLRTATEEEQEEWNRQRQDTSDGKYEGDAWEEEEPRGEPGTEADYDSLFGLMTSDYRELTVADFNMRLLDWTNENWERMERISGDTALKDFRVSMDEEKRNFVTLTVLLSGVENGKYVQSSYTGRKEDDPVYDRYLPEKADRDSLMAAWCDLYYQFSYHIADKETVTVGQRDACIGGMIQGVEDFWNETDLEELLKMTKTDILETLQRIAAEHSDDGITITIREDFVGFEKMDERRSAA